MSLKCHSHCLPKKILMALLELHACSLLSLSSLSRDHICSWGLRPCGVSLVPWGNSKFWLPCSGISLALYGPASPGQVPKLKAHHHVYSSRNFSPRYRKAAVILLLWKYLAVTPWNGGRWSKIESCGSESPMKPPIQENVGATQRPGEDGPQDGWPTGRTVCTSVCLRVVLGSSLESCHSEVPWIWRFLFHLILMVLRPERIAKLLWWAVRSLCVPGGAGGGHLASFPCQLQPRNLVTRPQIVQNENKWQFKQKRREKLVMD